MIRLSRKSLRDIARIYLLANTPYSLYAQLCSNESIRKLRDDSSMAELQIYYDQITARASRSELALGLAYGVLTAIFMKALLSANMEVPEIDSGRLRWGPQIEEYFRSDWSATNIVVVRGPSLKIQTSSVNAAPQKIETPPDAHALKPWRLSHAE
jgi:hypothetical protein